MGEDSSTRIDLFEKEMYPNTSFNLLQEIKDDLEPSSSHAIPDLSKLLQLATHHFFQRTVAYLLCLFATTLICAALDILHWSICK